MFTKSRLITSALPYVNNIPHLGNIIGCVLSADVFNRYNHLLQVKTLFICGTDEYGTATETKARELNLTPKEICDKFYKAHKKIYDYFNIKFDAFGRTSSLTHTEVVQNFFSYIEQNNPNFLIEKESKQFYSHKSGEFLADRFIIGECPHCYYEKACGDQCEQCGKMLSPTDLINPKSLVDDSKLSMKKTRHLYLNLPALKSQLNSFQKKQIKEGFWTENACKTTLSWMQQGIEPRAITRDLKWGVSVPKKGFESKVFYVWFDAPIGYISITKSFFPTQWKYWWCNPSDVNLYHFMAKDNVPFHSIIFPATQIATGKNWTQVFHLNSTEYLNYEDTKFSKSLGVGVFGDDVINTKIPVDLWRFYLLFIRPENQDTSFVWEDFFTKVNKEFIDNIGNLIHRVLVYCNKNFHSKINFSPFNFKQKKFYSLIKQRENKVFQLLEKVKLRDTLKEILALGRDGNRFFQEEEPWVQIKKAKKATHTSISLLILVVKDLSILLFPYMPKTSEKIQNLLGLKKKLLWKDLLNYDFLQGHHINKAKIIYRKLDESLIDEFKEKFNSKIKSNLCWEDTVIKLGKIIEVEKHSKADKLYILKIDLGEKKIRQIISGLVQFYSKKDLLFKEVLILTNLKKNKLRGKISEGMILVAENKSGLELLTSPQENIPLGTQILKEKQKPKTKIREISPEQFLSLKLNISKFFLKENEDFLFLNGKKVNTITINEGRVR